MEFSDWNWSDPIASFPRRCDKIQRRPRQVGSARAPPCPPLSCLAARSFTRRRSRCDLAAVSAWAKRGACAARGQVMLALAVMMTLLVLPFAREDKPRDVPYVVHGWCGIRTPRRWTRMPSPLRIADS